MWRGPTGPSPGLSGLRGTIDGPGRGRRRRQRLEREDAPAAPEPRWRARPSAPRRSLGPPPLVAAAAAEPARPRCRRFGPRGGVPSRPPPPVPARPQRQPAHGGAVGAGETSRRDAGSLAAGPASDSESLPRREPVVPAKCALTCGSRPLQISDPVTPHRAQRPLSTG